MADGESNFSGKEKRVQKVELKAFRDTEQKQQFTNQSTEASKKDKK